jgi:glucosamine 6-phosphate synthetase-like amidotransferase/phosphosugar isomerase protein
MTAFALHAARVLTPEGFHTSTITAERVGKTVHEVEWDLAQIEKSGFPHFMLKVGAAR